jgi:CHRD domain
MVTKIKTVAILSTAAAALLLLAFGTIGPTTLLVYPGMYRMFTAKLSASNEVPPVTTTASGIANFQIFPVGHQETLKYQLYLKNISGVTGAHIHKGKQGENGPVVADLFGTPSMSGPPTGKINGLLTAGTLYESKLTGPLTGKTIDILVNMIRNGNAYVNVHTTTNPNGEVRGQITS